MNLTVKFTRRRGFYVLFALLMILLFLKYSLQIYFSSMVFVAVLGTMCYVGNRDEIFAVCVCGIPLCAALPYHYVILICLLIYLLKYQKDIRVDSSFIPLLLIIVWEFAHCFSDGTSLKSMFVMSVQYVLFMVLFSIRNMKTDYGFIVRLFSFTVLWLCIVLIVQLMVLSKFNLDLFFLNMTRLGLIGEESLYMVNINTNSLGIQCVLAISCLLQLRLNAEKRKIDILLILLLLVFGALTISRTYLACLLIMVVYVFAVYKGDSNKKTRLLLRIIALVLLGILMLYLVFPTSLEAFIKRLQADDLSNGRNGLFIEYNDYLLSSIRSLWWGLGSIGLYYKVTNVHAIADNVPHNGIQEILVAWGIPGLLFVMIWFFTLIWRSKQENPRQTMINYLPFVIFLQRYRLDN